MNNKRRIVFQLITFLYHKLKVTQNLKDKTVIDENLTPSTRKYRWEGTQPHHLPTLLFNDSNLCILLNCHLIHFFPLRERKLTVQKVRNTSGCIIDKLFKKH